MKKSMKDVQCRPTVITSVKLGAHGNQLDPSLRQKADVARNDGERKEVVAHKVVILIGGNEVLDADRGFEDFDGPARMPGPVNSLQMG